MRRNKTRNGKELDQKQSQPNGNDGSRRRRRSKKGRHLPRHRLPQKAVVPIPIKPQEVLP